MRPLRPARGWSQQRLAGRAELSVLSFVLAGHSANEVGQALNRECIAVRTGHHRAQPMLRRFGLGRTVLSSRPFYNSCEVVDRMSAVVNQSLAATKR